MQTATITDLKKELKKLDNAKLMDLCLRLAKFKKDNKELLTYLLFEAQQEDAYIQSVKYVLDELLPGVKTRSDYVTKKNLRKILRQLDKHIRYSGNKQTEVELRIYFLRKTQEVGLPMRKRHSLSSIYEGQVKKIKTAISRLHEDLQFDYGLELADL